MTHSPTCLFCGYSRSVPVAGCDHATLPTASEEMASAFRAMEPDCDHETTGRVCAGCYGDVLREMDGYIGQLGPAEEELARLRAESSLLGAELVDLQRQVVALQDALEQERRDNGRLRADLESARQLLSEAERGGSVS